MQNMKHPWAVRNLRSRKKAEASKPILDADREAGWAYRPREPVPGRRLTGEEFARRKRELENGRGSGG